MSQAYKNLRVVVASGYARDYAKAREFFEQDCAACLEAALDPVGTMNHTISEANTHYLSQLFIRKL